jgi:hypothetical protein
MIVDSAEHVGKPSLWIDFELGPYGINIAARAQQQRR